MTIPLTDPFPIYFVDVRASTTGNDPIIGGVTDIATGGDLVGWTNPKLVRAVTWGDNIFIKYPSNPKKLNAIALAHATMHALGDIDHESNNRSLMYKELLDSWVSTPGNEPVLTLRPVNAILRNLNLNN